MTFIIGKLQSLMIHGDQYLFLLKQGPWTRKSRKNRLFCNFIGGAIALLVGVGGGLFVPALLAENVTVGNQASQEETAETVEVVNGKIEATSKHFKPPAGREFKRMDDVSGGAGVKVGRHVHASGTNLVEDDITFPSDFANDVQVKYRHLPLDPLNADLWDLFAWGKTKPLEGGGGSSGVTTPKDEKDWKVKTKVAGVKKIPLGGQAELRKGLIGKVYVPDKYGGTLTLAGTSIDLYYTDGSDLDMATANKILSGSLDDKRVAQGSPCAYPVREGKHGWYYARIPVDLSTVKASFVQTGTSQKKPWNAWYWPFSSDDSDRPTLYAKGGEYAPLKKYDSVYSTDTRATEESKCSKGLGWEGHCWGWSIAAAVHDQPKKTSKNGVNFNDDEMKGLYIELADGNDTGSGGWEFVFGGIRDDQTPASPTSALGEPIDKKAGEFQNVLRRRIRQERKIIFGDLRDVNGEDDSEIWNHDIYQYESRMAEDSGGNEKVVEIHTTLISNIDEDIPSDADDFRSDEHVYVLEYNAGGEIDEKSEKQNWISSSGYAPAFLGIISDQNVISWKPSHTSIEKGKVDSLYEQ